MIFFLSSILFSKYTLLPSMRGHSHHHHDHHHHFHRQLSSSSFIIDAHNWTNAVAHAHTTVTVLPTLSFALNIKYFLGLRGQTDGQTERSDQIDRQTVRQISNLNWRMKSYFLGFFAWPVVRLSVRSSVCLV